MKTIYSLAALVAVAAAGGCATQAQLQATAIRTNNLSSSGQFQACMANLYNSPDYAVIGAKLPQDASQATLLQLTDKSTATDSEIAAILALHPKVQGCQKAFLDQISNTTPTIVPIFADAEIASENSLIDLIEKKQPWGTHVMRVRQISADAQKQILAEGLKIQGQLSQSNEAELSQRRAAFEAMARYYQTQQIINKMDQPTFSRTNCNTLGSTINCTSITH